MKRITLVLVGGLALASLAFAQSATTGSTGTLARGPGRGMMGGIDQPAPEAKSIEGKLTFVNQVPAVQAKDAAYLIRMPGFFESAYFDGIKEGATVKADGYLMPALPGQDKPWFFVTKATINGKTYDFTTKAYGRGAMGGYGRMMDDDRGGYGRMRDGRGMMGGGMGRGRY